jgi:anaerobic magnesium-protoporphyrin IX monomethyl ester cyclase
MIKRKIDCLLIGHNEMEFAEYEKNLREMGVNSGAYRDLQKNFLRYNHRPYSPAEVFNIFCCHPGPGQSAAPDQPLEVAEGISPAIAYLGTYLQRRGYSFAYVRSFQEEKARLAETLGREQDNIVTIAIITTLYVSVLPILEIMELIKKSSNRAKVVIGGPFIANQVRALGADELAYLFDSLGADFYVHSSQGEAALVKIIHALNQGLSPEGIENIYYKKAAAWVSTPAVRENNPLSENMVDWELFPDALCQFVNIRTAISCPFSCTFCGFPQHAGAYQTAAVEAVERELTTLAHRKKTRRLHFIDDTFNVPVPRFKEILRLMIRNKYDFKWHSHFRCQFADKEVIELMKESGCQGVFLGIESGSEQILRNMNKAASVEKYRRGLQWLKEYEILTYGSFIIGFPGETRETAAETLEFIAHSPLDFYRAQLWYCDPLTPIWKERQTYRLNGSQFEWSHATMDSKTACDIIDDIFLSNRTPLWVPQYNFEFDGIFQLLHRGLTLDRVKQFLRAFNEAVKEKFLEPARKEVSLEAIKQLRQACLTPAAGDGRETEPLSQKIGRGEAEFDF